ncbi:MAG: hypothetical protein HY318_17710 [Armatimonadetes bacterium]|nr:hypothetical protein [Armatimonadota bacterium]
MIRFDTAQEPPRKSPWPETLWHSSGGVYPFLPPLAWTWMIVYLFGCASLDDSPSFPGHPIWLTDVWFADPPYVVLFLVWFLGFWPLALLCSFLYRRHSGGWWNRQEESFAQRKLSGLHLESLVRPGESLIAAVRLNCGGLAGGCAADVVIVASVVWTGLIVLITIAIFSVIYGPPVSAWIPGVAVGCVVLTFLRSLFAAPTIMGIFTTANCFWMLWAVETITNLMTLQEATLVPTGTLWLALLPLAIHLLRFARSPRLHWLVITDQRILSFVPQHSPLPVINRMLEDPDKWRHFLSYLYETCFCWLLFTKVKAEWEHGGAMTLTRNQHSDIVTVTSQGRRMQSMYITRHEAAALSQLISEKHLPWKLVDHRDAPKVQRRLRTVSWVDALVAIVIAVGAARVCAPLFSTGVTARYALLPTYEASQRGEARLYDDLMPRVLAARPNDALVWCYRAMSAEKLNRPDDACNSWQRALELTRGQGKVGRTATHRLRGYRDSARQ